MKLLVFMMYVSQSYFFISYFGSNLFQSFTFQFETATVGGVMLAICYSVIFVDVLGQIVYEETKYHPDGKANVHFLNRLLELEPWLLKKARQYVTMEWISAKRRVQILEKSIKCHHCGDAFKDGDTRVFDHDHYTGMYIPHTCQTKHFIHSFLPGAFIGIAHNEW